MKPAVVQWHKSVTGCGFDSHSKICNIYLNFYFHFFALVSWYKAVLPLNIQCHQNSAKNGALNVITLNSAWKELFYWMGRENTVLRHSIPHFLPNSGGIAVEWGRSTPLIASRLERKNENLNLNKYFISLSGNRTNNHSITQTYCYFIPLRHEWFQKFSLLMYRYFL